MRSAKLLTVSILDTLIWIVLSHAYNPWHFLFPTQVKTLQHQVVYLKPSRNLCHSCHRILCKENEQAKFSSRWQASRPGVSEKLMKSSLLFTLTLKSPFPEPVFLMGLRCGLIPPLLLPVSLKQTCLPRGALAALQPRAIWKAGSIISLNWVPQTMQWWEMKTEMA